MKALVEFRMTIAEARFGAGILALLALAGCASTPTAYPGPAQTQPDASLNQQLMQAAVPPSYVLRPADVISVSVFREEELSIPSVAISADGRVSFPLVGELQVAGLSLAQLESQLETELGARYLRDPNVAVNIVSYTSHQVTVEGAVDNPGMYPFQPGTRLSGGIALGGGVIREANREEIAVFRQTPAGMEVAKFDYNALQQGTMFDPVLLPGDRIVVGTDGLSVFWQDVLRSIPVFALFTRI